MKQLSSIFFKGLAAILPITITLYVLFWTGATAEAVLGGLLRWALPVDWHIPGLGLIAGVVLIFLLGLLLHAYLVERLWRAFENLLTRIPLVNSIYSATQELMGFFSSGNQQKSLGQVVTLPYGPSGYRVIGFVTREYLEGLPGGLQDPEHALVYLPISYGIGGYTLLVPRTVLRPVDMTVEQAMRLVITAGLSAGSTPTAPPPGNPPAPPP